MTNPLEELRKLPVDERLRIIEVLWDDLCAESGAPVVQAWQRDEVRRRAEELEANPEIALTREQMWQSVDDARD